MNLLFRIFISLKNLKFSQVLHRIKKIFLVNAGSIDPVHIPERNFPKHWCVHNLYDDCFKNNFTFNILNKKKKLKLPEDWNSDYPSTLWTYNLNYFNFLDTKNSQINKNRNYELIDNWINFSKEKNKISWDPFPTSIRIVNFIKYWFAGNSLDDKIFKSIYTQSCYLRNNLELDLLANHYLSNLKALLFASLVFKRNDWLSFSVKELNIQISEQFQDDGSHYEGSQMYHRLALVDLLDMYNLTRSYNDDSLNALKNKLENVIPKAIFFMNSMDFSRNHIPYFNDASNRIAPDISLINNYSKKLNKKFNSLCNKKHNLLDFSESGYYCILLPSLSLIFSAGEKKPKYNPGHAHADTLSIELEVLGQMVFVNSGISTYEVSQERLKQRGTISSNTVQIDNANSSDVWKSFRLGKRAEIIQRTSKNYKNEIFYLSASHNGYKKILSGCIHKRSIEASKNYIKISDKIFGIYKKAISRLYLHPALKVEQRDNLILISGNKFTMEAKVNSDLITLKETEWHPEFGKSIKNICIEKEIIDGEGSIEFSISLRQD